MPLFTQESLEHLEKLNLVDLLSQHLEMKKNGAFYKALCPFHEEKSPSFMVKERGIPTTTALVAELMEMLSNLQ